MMKTSKNKLDLETLIGSLLYPNDMNKALSKSERQRRSTLNLVHKTLYSFSNNNLHNLLQKSQAFRLVLAIALNNKDEFFQLSIPEEDDDQADDLEKNDRNDPLSSVIGKRSRQPKGISQQSSDYPSSSSIESPFSLEHPVANLNMCRDVLIPDIMIKTQCVEEQKTAITPGTTKLDATKCAGGKGP